MANQCPVVSLGNYCLTSMILKDNGIKAQSYPYDWMVSCIENVHHGIQDSFSEFLRKSNYQSVAGKTRNTFYYKHTQNLFPSDMLAGRDHQHHDLSSDDGYAYIGRCVARFRGLDKHKAVVFVMIQPLYLKSRGSNDQDVQALYNLLAGRLPGTRIVLLVFNIVRAVNESYREVELDGDCYVYELESAMGKGRFGMMWYDSRGIGKFLEIVRRWRAIVS